MSFVYKVDKDNFYDIPGLLYGDKFRNYQDRSNIWHWKRLAPYDEENLEVKRIASDEWIAATDSRLSSLLYLANSRRKWGFPILRPGFP